MPVEELASVIGIKAQDGEGQGRFDLRDAFRYCGQASVGNGARLSPLGVHIGGGDAPAKFPRHALSAMRHGVGFDKPRTAHLPVLGANGDLTAQQCARTRAAAAPAAQSDPAGRQQSVDRGRARRQHFHLHFAIQLTVALLIKRQPQRQRGFEPFAAGLFRTQPDRFNHFAFHRSVNPLRSSTTPSAFSHDRPAAAQQLARILAIHNRTEQSNLIQQAGSGTGFATRLP